MKQWTINASLLFQTISILFATTMEVAARPIGGWANNANQSGSSIAWDSPMGIIILVSIAVFLLVIFLVVFWAWKKGKLRIKKR